MPSCFELTALTAQLSIIAGSVFCLSLGLSRTHSFHRGHLLAHTAAQACSWCQLSGLVDVSCISETGVWQYFTCVSALGTTPGGWWSDVKLVAPRRTNFAQALMHNLPYYYKLATQLLS